jgi:FkbM family methyltransferase
MPAKQAAVRARAKKQIIEHKDIVDSPIRSPSPLSSHWRTNPPTLDEAILTFLKNNAAMSFVQVGGFDGVSFDPIRRFIQGGRLSGLIIEPLPDPFAKLETLYAGSKAVQIANCAIHLEDGEQTLWRFQPAAIEQGILNPSFAGTSSFCMDKMLADDGSLGKLFSDKERDLLRSLIEPVSVATRSFASLLDERGITQVDLLQIDTEGYELNILKSFDFTRYTPAIVNFEHIHLSQADFQEITVLLEGFGYQLFKQSADTLAVRTEALCGIPHREKQRDNAPDLHGFDGVRGNVVFCTWTGTNPMSPHRAEALLSIYGQICCPVMFLNVNNIRKWEQPSSPFHAAFDFLSETHKSDYLRCYLLHHFGGGYTDLKRTTLSWMPSFELLRESPDAFGLGYKEIGPHGVAPCGEPLESELRRNYDKLIGNSAYIFKKDTLFTRRWIASVHSLLDAKLDMLRLHPARHPMDQTNVVLPDQSVSQYPLRWSEMLGDIFHPLAYEFRNHLIQADIAPSFQNYR